MRNRDNKKPVVSAHEVSRRKFLKSAATGSAVLATVATLPAQTAPVVNTDILKSGDPLGKILAGFGSEFGDIRDI